MMNDTPRTNRRAAPAANEGRTPPQFRPSLAFYHPNGKGTGCAVKMRLCPAHDSVDGAIMLTVANQMTIGNRMGPNPTFPRFDWENPICVKLGFADLCKLLQVFRGECETLEDSRGIYHRSASGSTRIVLRHVLEPVSGYSLELYRTPTQGEELRAHFMFTLWEALGVMEAIVGSMSVICFGVPMVTAQESAAYEAENRGLRNATAA